MMKNTHRDAILDEIKNYDCQIGEIGFGGKHAYIEIVTPNSFRRKLYYSQGSTSESGRAALNLRSYVRRVMRELNIKPKAPPDTLLKAKKPPVHQKVIFDHNAPQPDVITSNILVSPQAASALSHHALTSRLPMPKAHGDGVSQPVPITVKVPTEDQPREPAMSTENPATESKTGRDDKKPRVVLTAKQFGFGTRLIMENSEVGEGDFRRYKDAWNDERVLEVLTAAFPDREKPDIHHVKRLRQDSFPDWEPTLRKMNADKAGPVAKWTERLRQHLEEQIARLEKRIEDLEAVVTKPASKVTNGTHAPSQPEYRGPSWAQGRQ